MKIINRKGFSGQVMILASSALALVVAGLIMSYGSKISFDLRKDTATAYNSTTGVFTDTVASSSVGNATEGISRLAKQTPLVGTVLAAVVIISLLLVGFGGFLAGRRR